MTVLQRIWRPLYWLPQDLAYLWRARFPQLVLHWGGHSYGDYLLFGTVIAEARRRKDCRIAVVTEREEIFRHWPGGVRFFFGEFRALQSVRLCGARLASPRYYLHQHPPVYDTPARGHIITEMCRSAGLTGTVALRTYFYLTDEEKRRGRLVANQAVIQATSATSLTSSWLKHWPTERYQEVVHRLSGRVQFVQLGTEGEPALDGVIDLRGKTTLRESAAILARSRLYVGYVGFLMHLARAVDIRSVIVFGGRERPDQSGYACNENLFTPLSCSPCWRLSTCDYDRLCMQRITIEQVVDAVKRVLAKEGSPLELSHEDIPATPTEFSLPWKQESFIPPV